MPKKAAHVIPFTRCDQCPGQQAKPDGSPGRVCPKYRGKAECWYQINRRYPDLETTAGIMDAARNQVLLNIVRFEQAVREERFAGRLDPKVTSLGSAVRQDLEMLTKLGRDLGYIRIHDDSEPPPALQVGEINILEMTPEILDQIKQLKAQLVQVEAQGMEAAMPILEGALEDAEGTDGQAKDDGGGR